MAKIRAAVIGGSGYGGGEIIRRLVHHPGVELVRVASIDHVGEPIWAVHPNLEGQTSLTFEGIPPEEAAKGVDVVLLGLPHKVSATVMGKLMASGARVVDLSGDFRLRDPKAYEKYYGAKHPCPDELVRGTFVYGLPELNREAIKKAKYVASPGCFATTIELALLPLAKAGLLSGAVEIVGITGSSGSGIKESAGTHHPVRSLNLRTYKPLEHQHVPEIVETLAFAGAKNLTLRFVPVSAPLSRGIFATCFAHLNEEATGDRIKSLYRETYASEPFVRVPAKRLPEVVAVSGSNYAEVSAVKGDGDLVTAFAATDNLIKGGAGQAIQSMNLMFGFDERSSLEDRGDIRDEEPLQADRQPEGPKMIVVKIGGEIVKSGAIATLAIDLAELARSGQSIVIVHGGGPQATELQKQLGQTPNIVAGRRITDAATLDVMKMAVAGLVNVDLCAALFHAGCKPVGLHGASSGAIAAKKRPPKIVAGAGPDPIDFGLVGDVTGVNRELLKALISAVFMPVLACLGCDDAGQTYNINADTVANQVAVALDAQALVVVSDVPGVLRDVADPTSRIPKMTKAEADAAIASGVVTKGMIPKLEESFAAIAAGVRSVLVVGKLARGELARAVREPGSVGTALFPG